MLNFAALATIAFGSQTLKASGLGECIGNGIESGRFAAQQFCGSLETAYSNRTVVQSVVSERPKLCNAAILIACRTALRINVRKQSLCSRLIEDNWDGARDSFNSFIAVACPKL